MNRLGAMVLVMAVCAPAFAAAPGDFRSGIELQPEAGHPVQQLDLPDAVYQGVRRSNLADVQVFNAEGTPVSYALCAPAMPIAAPPVEVPLQVFPLQRASNVVTGGTRLLVGTAGTVTVDVRPGEPAPAGAVAVAAYVIDARSVAAPLHALRVHWHTQDGTSELHVRVDASEDLDSWRTLVPQATLVRADAGGQLLERQRIPLPPAKISYLRLTRTDGGPAPVLDEAIGEIDAAVPPDRLRWFDTVPQGQGADRAYGFDAAHLAPVSIAQIVLPVPNLALRLSLQSRPRADSAWNEVWTGTVFSIGDGLEQRHSDDIALPEDSDRYWRIRIVQNEESLGARAPALRLGYRPARLRFLAQGSGLFTLAYGSSRVESASRPVCDGLLQGLPTSDLEHLIGQARPGAEHALGGDTALAAPPQPMPLRQYLLWGVLLAGAAAVAWMALGLLRALRD